jgi:hypothetical protein
VKNLEGCDKMACFRALSWDLQKGPRETRITGVQIASSRVNALRTDGEDAMFSCSLHYDALCDGPDR